MCIENISKYLYEYNLGVEILVVDNGSTDNTFVTALRKGAKVVYEKNKGYGNAIRKGIQEANGEIIIILDADCSYKLEQLKEFINAFEMGYDFVIGNRFKGGIQKGAMSISHRIGIPFLTKLANLRFHTNLGDYHCGLRAFRKSIYNNVQFKSSGMEFATEMIAQAEFNNAKMCEIPIHLYRDERGKRSHLRTIRDGLRHLAYIINPS